MAKELTNKQRLSNIESTLRSFKTELNKTRKMVDEQKEVLDYQTKLIESIVEVISENQSKSRKKLANVSAMKQVFSNHPMMKANPQAQNLFNSLLSTVDEG